MTELLPCPFCGGEADMKHVTQLWEPRNSYWAQCDNCRMSGKHFTTEAEAIAAWNTRSERTCKADYRSGGYGIGGWYCSECGGYMHDDMQQDMCYCPNCGAKVE